MTDFALLESSKLISRKIWVIENSWNSTFFESNLISKCLLNFRPDGSKKENDQKDSYAKDVFELPPELANPQKAPCVNVPEWFVKEGGELCLSDTANGLSIIR